MGAKEDLFAAARSLHDQGRDPFALVDVVAEARKLGSTYPDVTLRSMVSHHLRIDKRSVPGGVGFYQVSRGFYRLASSDGGITAVLLNQKEVPIAAAEVDEQSAAQSNDGHEWFWEGNIQAALVRHLANDGWRIRRVADTHSREHGVDIEADRGGIMLLVEVKGYPSATYLNGPNEGQKKNFGVGAQARTYFGNAVLTGLLMRSDNVDARVVLVFPALATFQTLARRSAHPLGLAGIEIWLVKENGQVTHNDSKEVEPLELDSELLSKFEWRPEDVVILNPGDEDSVSVEDGEEPHPIE
jgi:Holliday junction resolvase